MSSEYEAIAARATEAWNASDWEALEAMVTTDVVAIGPSAFPEAGDRNGWPEVRDQFERLKEPWESERFDVTGIRETEIGALVTGCWVCRGTGSGLDLETPIWIHYVVADGLIARMQFFIAEDEAMEASGLGKTDR